MIDRWVCPWIAMVHHRQTGIFFLFFFWEEAKKKRKKNIMNCQRILDNANEKRRQRKTKNIYKIEWNGKTNSHRICLSLVKMCTFAPVIFGTDNSVTDNSYCIHCLGWRLIRLFANSSTPDRRTIFCPSQRLRLASIQTYSDWVDRCASEHEEKINRSENGKWIRRWMWLNSLKKSGKRTWWEDKQPIRQGWIGSNRRCA